MTTQNDETREEWDKLIELVTAVISNRKRPMLVLFYPGDLDMDGRQIKLLHTALVSSGLRRAEPLECLDVLIHTVGGEPTAAYRLAQVIRDYTNELVFLVPEYAYSGGTLVCLAGNIILLGAHAVLSPIDITLHRKRIADRQDESFRYTEEEEEETEIQLVAIDHFIKVATQARIDIENEFRRRQWKMAKSDVESAMLCQMIKELGVIEIATLYREKNITEAYARELLGSYMFASRSLSGQDMDRILRRLVVEAPAHEFPMDYHICKDVGLEVEEMPDALSEQCLALLRQLMEMADKRIICDAEGDIWLPLFQYFPYTMEETLDTTEKAVSVSKEARNSDGNRKERGQTQDN